MFFAFFIGEMHPLIAAFGDGLHTLETSIALLGHFAVFPLLVSMPRGVKFGECFFRLDDLFTIPAILLPCTKTMHKQFKNKARGMISVISCF